MFYVENENKNWLKSENTFQMNYNCGLYSMPVCDAKIHDFEFERNGKLLSFWVNYIFQAMGPLHRTEEVFLTQEVQMSRNRIFVGTFFWRVSFFSFFSQHHLLNLSRLIITARFSTKESFYQKKSFNNILYNITKAILHACLESPEKCWSWCL